MAQTAGDKTQGTWVNGTFRYTVMSFLSRFYLSTVAGMYLCGDCHRLPTGSVESGRVVFSLARQPMPIIPGLGSWKQGSQCDPQLYRKSLSQQTRQTNPTMKNGLMQDKVLP